MNPLSILAAAVAFFVVDAAVELGKATKRDKEETPPETPKPKKKKKATPPPPDDAPDDA